jgi:hypothetical protein
MEGAVAMVDAVVLIAAVNRECDLYMVAFSHFSFRPNFSTRRTVAPRLKKRLKQ